MAHLKEVLSRKPFKRKKTGFIGWRERLQKWAQKDKKRSVRENLVGVVALEFDLLPSTDIRTPIVLKFWWAVPVIKKFTSKGWIEVSYALFQVLQIYVSCTSFSCSILLDEDCCQGCCLDPCVLLNRYEGRLYPLVHWVIVEVLVP